MARRSRRLATTAAAAPSPSTPPPTRLLALSMVLLVRALSRCNPADIARVAAYSDSKKVETLVPVCVCVSVRDLGGGSTQLSGRREHY